MGTTLVTMKTTKSGVDSFSIHSNRYVHGVDWNWTVVRTFDDDNTTCALRNADVFVVNCNHTAACNLYHIFSVLVYDL